MGKKMNPRVKALWLEWLRDPSNKQTTGCLKDSSNGFCCLGGLTQCFVNDTGIGYWLARDDKALPEYFYINQSDADANNDNLVEISLLEAYVLPGAVCQWAELETADPLLGTAQASSHNDGKGTPQLTFEQIADLVEEHL